MKYHEISRVQPPWFSPGWKAERPEVAGWQAGLLPGPFFLGGMIIHS